MLSHSVKNEAVSTMIRESLAKQGIAHINDLENKVNTKLADYLNDTAATESFLNGVILDEM